MFTHNDYINMSRTFMECVSRDVLDACMLNETETHQKFRKRMGRLAAITNDLDLKQALDDVHVYETQSNGACVVPVRRGRPEIYDSLGRILMAYAETERTGGLHPFYTRMLLPKTNYDEGQIPLFTSVLWVQNFRMGESRSDRYDFHWFLSYQKTLVVVLTPFLGHSQKPETVLEFIFACGLKQNFAPCANCAKVVPSVAHCCAKIWYCNRECQRNDWSLHKEVCTRYTGVTGATGVTDVTGPASSELAVYVPEATLSSVESAMSRLELLGSAVAEVSRCAVCAASGLLKACKCGILYCSKSCQNSDWPAHKKVCKKLQQSLQASKICSKCGKAADGSICIKCALK